MGNATKIEIMNTHVDKTQNHKSKSVASAVSLKRGVNKSNFQVVDNRPEAMVQRKLEAMANTSVQAMQLRAFQNITNNAPGGNGVLQRMLKKDGMTMSQGRKYVIKDENNKQLFCGVNDRAPAPQTLFNRTGAATINIPYRDPGTGEEYTENQPYNIYEPVIKLGKNNAQENPNDCGMYARALINDKGPRFGYNPNITEGLEVRGEVDMQNINSKERQNAVTGEMYLIKTDDGQQERHHGATVIAEDGPDHVTSEAHSSKDLQVPEFAMYGVGDQSFYSVHHKDYDRSGVPAYMQILGKKNPDKK